MKFSEVVAQTLAWLQRDGRVSYRALKREFDLDDEFLEDVKAELIEALPGMVESVSVGKPTLEDVFIRVTGKSFKDAETRNPNDE